MPPKVNALLFQNCLPHDIQLLKHRTLTCLNVEWKDSSYVKKSSPSLHGDYTGMCRTPDNVVCSAAVRFHDQFEVHGYNRLYFKKKTYIIREIKYIA
jgi:hypothetical protein